MTCRVNGRALGCIVERKGLWGLNPWLLERGDPGRWEMKAVYRACCVKGQATEYENWAITLQLYGLASPRIFCAILVTAFEGCSCS